MSKELTEKKKILLLNKLNFDKEYSYQELSKILSHEDIKILLKDGLLTHRNKGFGNPSKGKIEIILSFTFDNPNSIIYVTTQGKDFYCKNKSLYLINWYEHPITKIISAIVAIYGSYQMFLQFVKQ